MNRRALVAFFLFLVNSAPAGEVLEDTIEKTLPLGPNGSFSLQAIDGSVEIYGAETDTVQIVATRKAFSPARVNAIRIEISGVADAVNVNTEIPPTPRWAMTDHSGTVDYVIKLPQRARIASVRVPNGELIIHGMRGGAVEAFLGNGRLISHNCFCDQKLEVASGGLDLFWDWDELRPITIEGAVRNGNVHAIVPGDASFRLRATSEHGRIASDFTEMSERRRGGVATINEVIGPAPFSQLTLRTKEGNIQIAEAAW